MCCYTKTRVTEPCAATYNFGNRVTLGLTHATITVTILVALVLPHPTLVVTSIVTLDLLHINI